MKQNNSQLFYRLTPILIIIFALIITASAFWEWRVAPLAGIKGYEALKNDNYSEAIRKFSQAQQYCETDISARYYLGVAYHNYAWDDEALKNYDTTWNLASNYGANAMHNAGRIWLKKGNTKKAIQCFNRALSINQAMPEVWFELGTVYLIMKNAKSAESCISKAVKYDPKNKQYRQLLLSLALQRQQKINYDK